MAHHEREICECSPARFWEAREGSLPAGPGSGWGWEWQEDLVELSMAAREGTVLPMALHVAMETKLDP